MKSAMNVLQALCLLSCFSVYLAAEVRGKFRHEGDAEFEGYLREALENFRIQMPKGIPEINMPVLDPLKLNDMDFQINENIATLSLKLRKVSISGLSGFSVNHIQANLEDLFLHLNLSIPLLDIDGYYNLQGRLLKIFPVNGEGQMSLNATSVNVAGTGQLQLTKEGAFMNELKFDLSWEQMTANLENFMGGGSFSEVLQRMIPGVGRDLFLKYKPLILAPLENALKGKINEALDKQIVKDILKEILPKC